jgi:hypothetical protein
VTRLRIGDAVGSYAGGLPGVLRNLGIDYSDTIWELRSGMKVPRSFKVNVDFLALHDGSVGLLNGQFGVFQLPPPTKQGSTADTTNSTAQGSPTVSRDSTVPATGPSYVPNGFTRFGATVKKGS